MRFVNGICLECKHEIQIDTNKITATCPFCGSLYNVEETINQKDNVLSELNENKKIKKLYHDVEKGVSVCVQDNIQLCINTDNNIIGYILLIQISNKEKEVLNTYYLEARDKNYIDLKPTIDKFNNYGIIELYIQIKISTEKNKNNDKYTYSYYTYNYSNWIDFGSISLCRKRPKKQRERSEREAGPEATHAFVCWLIIMSILFFVLVSPLVLSQLENNMDSAVSDSSNYMSEVATESSMDAGTYDKVGINLNYSTDDKRFKIVNVEYNSPAERAGLKPGDTILSIDGLNITKKQDLIDMLSSHIKENPYIFIIERYDIERTIKVNCSEIIVAEPTKEIEVTESEPIEIQTQSKNKSSSGKIGVTISSLMNGKYIITNVEENSPAEHGGIQTGDIVISIDGIEIHEDWDLQTVLLKHNTGNPYTYIVNRDGEEKKLIISMDE